MTTSPPSAHKDIDDDQARESLSNGFASLSMDFGCSGEGESRQCLPKKLVYEDKELPLLLEDDQSRNNIDSNGSNSLPVEGSSNGTCKGGEGWPKKLEYRGKMSSSTELLPTTMPWEFDLIESEFAIPPWEHDILLLDINKGILESTVSNVLQRPYLQPWVGPSTKWPVQGKVFGVNNRLMVSMSTSLSTKKALEIDVAPTKVAVHYVVDTGAPTTFLCEDAVQALSPMKKFYYDEYMCIPVLIHGYKCQVHVSPAKSHFKDVSVIGSDLLSLIHAKLIVDYGEGKEFSLVKGPNIYEPADDWP